MDNLNCGRGRKEKGYYGVRHTDVGGSAPEVGMSLADGAQVKVEPSGIQKLIQVRCRLTYLATHGAYLLC